MTTTRPRARRRPALALAALTAALLSGCGLTMDLDLGNTSYDGTMTFSDDTGYVLTAGTDEECATALDSEGQADGAGVTIEATEIDGAPACRVTFSGAPYDDADDPDATIFREGDEIHVDLSGILGGDTSGVLMVEVTLTFPGEVLEAAGGDVSGSTVSFTSADQYTGGDVIGAVGGGFAWWLVLVVVVVVLAVAGVIVLLVLKNRQKPAAAGGAPFGQPGYPTPFGQQPPAGQAAWGQQPPPGGAPGQHAWGQQPSGAPGQQAWGQQPQPAPGPWGQQQPQTPSQQPPEGQPPHGFPQMATPQQQAPGPEQRFAPPAGWSQQQPAAPNPALEPQQPATPASYPSSEQQPAPLPPQVPVDPAPSTPDPEQQPSPPVGEPGAEATGPSEGEPPSSSIEDLEQTRKRDDGWPGGPSV